VPQLAVQQASKGHVVYVIKDDGTAALRPVVVGDYSGEKGILVASGLQDGDRVVVDGALKVVPGQPVKIAEPGSARPRKRTRPARREGRRRGKEEIDGRPVFTHFFIDRPILSSVISLLIVLAGAVSLSCCRSSKYPEMAPPEVTIDAIYPGATAEVIASNVARRSKCR